jgi:hypothetical protein
LACIANGPIESPESVIEGILGVLEGVETNDRAF